MTRGFWVCWYSLIHHVNMSFDPSCQHIPCVCCTFESLLVVGYHLRICFVVRSNDPIDDVPKLNTKITSSLSLILFWTKIRFVVQRSIGSSSFICFGQISGTSLFCSLDMFPLHKNPIVFSWENYLWSNCRRTTYSPFHLAYLLIALTLLQHYPRHSKDCFLPDFLCRSQRNACNFSWSRVPRF